MSGALYKSGRDRLYPAPSFLMSCIWLTGLLLGLTVAFCFKDRLFELVPIIYSVHSLSLLKLLFALLLFLLSVLTVLLSCPKWLYLICGLKAVHTAMFSFLLFMCYGQAGWLARWLFMFFDVCSMPLLFLYWMRSISKIWRNSFLEHTLLFCAMALLAIIDYRIVTPYAVKFVII